VIEIVAWGSSGGGRREPETGCLRDADRGRSHGVVVAVFVVSVVVVVEGDAVVLAKTQPLDPGVHAGAGSSAPTVDSRIGEVTAPELVVTCTDVGSVSHGHHAKYQPFWTVAATVSPLAKANVTAEMLLPACPSMCSPYPPPVRRRLIASARCVRFGFLSSAFRARPPLLSPKPLYVS